MKCKCCFSDNLIRGPYGIMRYYACKDCGLMFVPTEENEENNYLRENLETHYQDYDPHKSVADSKQDFFNSAMDHLSDRFTGQDKSILDVGCGYGYFLEKAKQRGWHASGVEITGIAVENAIKHNRGDDIFHGTLKEREFPDGTFDAVTLWDVMVMFPDLEPDLEECFRVLKGGGLLGIRVRNGFFQKLLFHLYRPVQGIAPRLGIKRPFVFHRYSFTSQSIYHLLKRTGFTEIRVLNSPLTKGDPYRHTGISGLVGAVKKAVDLISRITFKLSGGKIVTGPSLLIWAEKPLSGQH